MEFLGKSGHCNLLGVLSKTTIRPNEGSRLQENSGREST